MRPKLLFAAATFNLAETTRMIEVARACVDHFRSEFMGYGGEFVSLIEAAGFPFHLLQPELTAEKIEYLWKVDRLETYGQPFSEAELQQRVRSELDLYDRLSPNAIVMGSVLSASISARVARIPLVNIVPFPLTRPYLKAGLTVFPDLPQVPVVRWIPGRWINTLINRFLLYVPLMMGNFSKVARSYGFGSFPSFIGVWEGDYNLVTDLPMLTGVPNLPANWAYVGPIFAHLQEPIPEEVLALAEKRDRALVYFAMGSSGNSEVVKTVLESFAGLPVQVIAPVKAHLEKIEAHVPDNVLVTDWLPAHRVNPLVDLAVIHGGQGTVQTALSSGTPFLGVGMQPEQDINIEFAVRWGSAIRIPKKRVTTQAVREAILKLLGDEHARQRARELQAEYERWNGPALAADILQENFNTPAPPAYYRPMQNLEGERIDVRKLVLASLALFAGGAIWRSRKMSRRRTRGN
jgi:UDP:flavonoid glycosyltransferase YjiC (YdhE family)